LTSNLSEATELVKSVMNGVIGSLAFLIAAATFLRSSSKDLHDEKQKRRDRMLTRMSAGGVIPGLAGDFGGLLSGSHWRNVFASRLPFFYLIVLNCAVNLIVGTLILLSPYDAFGLAFVNPFVLTFLFLIIGLSLLLADVASSVIQD